LIVAEALSEKKKPESAVSETSTHQASGSGAEPKMQLKTTSLGKNAKRGDHNL